MLRYGFGKKMFEVSHNDLRKRRKILGILRDESVISRDDIERVLKESGLSEEFKKGTIIFSGFQKPKE